MKKKWIGVAGLLTAGALCLGGCSSAAFPYDNQIHPENNNAYISELFYRNDLGTLAPDPCVIQITDEESSEYGYYYLYATTDPDIGFRAYRNKDLTGEWEDVTPQKDFLAFESKGGHFAYGNGALWAPEVIYDEVEDLYYLYYSGAVKVFDRDRGSEAPSHRMIGVAVAEEPYGPFEPVESDGLNAATPLFDNEDMLARMRNMGIATGVIGGKNDSGVEETMNAFNCIDPHPYVAPDGAKYLYFVHEGTAYGLKSDIFVVEMASWTKPLLDSLTRVSKCGSYTVDDSYTDESGSTCPDYEVDNYVNEGPYMYQKQMADNSWKYFLTLSINGYTDKSYSVIQAVGDSPMGPFRKLTDAEGGLLVSTDWQRFDHLSGTGHHSFIEVDDELYIAYHEHVARETGGTGERDVAVDRVMWTKNNAGDDVLYCNGPTWSLQPRIAKYSGYSNLARGAKVTASSGENVEALTDGLLSIYTNNTFVKEFETKKKTTITIDLNGYREVSAVMIYNSKTFENAFVSVSKIEFDYELDGETGTAQIKDLAFDWDFYKMATSAAMRPGGSAVAVINPLKVKEIRITLDFEERPDEIAIMDEEGWIIKQETIGVSEIVVLGK